MADPEDNEYLNIRVYRRDKLRMRKLAESLITTNAKKNSTLKLMLLTHKGKLKAGAVDDAISFDAILEDYERLKKGHQ